MTAPASTTTPLADPPPPTTRRRPDPRWLLTALAVPPAGYVAHLVSGPVDSPSAALVGGLLAGAGIGAGQWALLRRRGIGLAWVAATALGLAAGLVAGAAAVSYRTDRPSLAAMGAVCGLAVGMAQGRLLQGTASRAVAWSVLTSALWGLGWAVSDGIGVHTEEQFVVFGISGALVVALVQSSTLDLFVPRTPQVTS